MDSKNTETSGSFFRQSAWMVAATVLGGAAMMLVHSFVQGKGGAPVYAEFKALLSGFYLIAAGAGGLWTLFAQQTSAALTPQKEASLMTAARRIMGVLGVLWLLLAVGLWMRQDAIMKDYTLANPLSLWATWALGLVTLWTSVVRGLVQGRQNFLALGLVAILDGFGRLTAVWMILGWMSGKAAGAMTGALMGATAALIAGIAGSRSLWSRPAAPVDWGMWMRRLAPLIASAAALQCLQQFDSLFWKRVISADNAERWNIGSLYSPAATIGFGLTQFIVPLGLVMLPRIARSAAKGEGSNSLRLTLLSALVMGGLAVIVCSIFPRLPLQIMFFKSPNNWESAPLVPWMTAAMFAYTLASVLLGNLFARERFGVVPGMVVLSAGYAATLWMQQGRFLNMPPMDAYRLAVQILGGFCLLLLVWTILFSWKELREMVR